MKEYDYRVPDGVVEKVSTAIDKLSNRDLLKLLGTIEQFQQTREERFTKTKEYFESAILPGLCDFAEMTSSVLRVEECDKKMSTQVIFKNPLGFDITESHRIIRSLLLLANYISIGTEDGDAILSLVYEYKEI